MSAIHSLYHKTECWTGLNSFQKKPWFLCVCSTSLLKTLWEKKKLLVASKLLLFSTVSSTRMENFLPFPSNLKSSSANSYSLEKFKICSLGKG